MSNRIPVAIKRPVSRTVAHAEWLVKRHRYPQNVIFVASLPKSGSTWLRDMFSSLPGFHSYQPDHVTPTNNDHRPDTFRAYNRQKSGRKPSQEDQKSFARKGVSGDWRNKFTREHKARFKDIAGDLLIELGYEKDNDW